MNEEETLPATEARDLESRDLDTLGTEALVSRLIEANARVLDAVRAAAPGIVRAVETIGAALEAGGRLHYVGAGTSGRLGTLDAAELPPTFGTAPDLVVAHIAGGAVALTHAVEGAEDDAGEGEAVAERVRGNDVVLGISASGGAAYVVAALAASRIAGACTIAMTSVAGSPLALAADFAIVIDSGPEPIAGSTRLRAGTAQKIALNALSTAVMVRANKIYDNYMVDVVATNAKLRARAERLVRTIAGIDATQATDILVRAEGNTKLAIVMAACDVDAERGRDLLAAGRGSLRAVLGGRP